MVQDLAVACPFVLRTLQQRASEQKRASHLHEVVPSWWKLCLELHVQP